MRTLKARSDAYRKNFSLLLMASLSSYSFASSHENKVALSIQSTFSQSSFGLQATLNPIDDQEDFLTEVAPYLEGCKLLPSKQELKAKSSHKLFLIQCHGVSFLNAYIKVNSREDGSLMVSSKLPKNITIDRIDSAKSHCSDNIKYVEHNEKYVPLNVEIKKDLINFREPQSCNLLFSESRAIEVQAEVHYENRNSDIEFRELKHINDSGFLDNEKFAVFGSYRASERAFAEDLVFNKNSNPIIQDQIQTFFNIDNALTKLNEIFNLEIKEPFFVFTHTDLPNNARYLPPYGEYTGEIQIGTPDEIFMDNLNNDADVIVHELGHHILFPYVSTIEGESTILHEGTADYLAYMVHGNERLGETIVLDSPYLRSNEAVENLLYDEQRLVWRQHQLGQFWSAYLSRLTKMHPDIFPNIYINSLAFYSPNANINEAIIALLESAESQGMLSNDLQCDFINEAAKLGFVDAIKGIDSSSCNIKKPFIRYRAAPIDKNDTQKGVVESVANGCGSIGMGSRPSALILYLIPFMCLFFRRLL